MSGELKTPLEMAINHLVDKIDLFARFCNKCYYKPKLISNEAPFFLVCQCANKKVFHNLEDMAIEELSSEYQKIVAYQRIFNELYCKWNDRGFQTQPHITNEENI